MLLEKRILNRSDIRGREKPALPNKASLVERIIRAIRNSIIPPDSRVLHYLHVYQFIFELIYLVIFSVTAE